MGLRKVVKMRFKEKDLEKMTKAQLIKHIGDLYVEIDELDKPVKRIFVENAPNVVQDYVKRREQEVKR